MSGAAVEARRLRGETARFLQSAALAREIEYDKLQGAYETHLASLGSRTAAAGLLLGGMGYEPPFPVTMRQAAEMVTTDEAAYLAEADLYVLSPQMCDVVIAAAQTLTWEDFALLGEEDLPSPTGVVVLPRPVIVRAFIGELGDLRAFTWRTPMRMRFQDERTKQERVAEAVRISTYNDTNGPVRPDSFRDQPLCADCATPDAISWKTCPSCGTTGRLLNRGPCRRCHLHDRLDQLLADPATGHLRAELHPLRRALADVDRPEAALAWIRRDKVHTLLTELATGHRPLTDAALDELPDSKTLRHLRSVLVATSCLPARDEHLAQLERWIHHVVANRPDPEQKQLLHSYAVWHVLRRLRHRTRTTPTTHNQAYVARHNITAATAFLDPLTERDLTPAHLHPGRPGHMDRRRERRTARRHRELPAVGQTPQAHPPGEAAKPL